MWAAKTAQHHTTDCYPRLDARCQGFARLGRISVVVLVGQQASWGMNPLAMQAVYKQVVTKLASMTKVWLIK